MNETNTMVAGLSDSFSESDGRKALEYLASRIKESGKRPIVRIKRLCKQTIDDDDNLTSSVRYILNATKRSGLIPDDSRKEIRLRVAQTKVKSAKEIGTVIEIEYE